jgi:hypothetical protein
VSILNYQNDPDGQKRRVERHGKVDNQKIAGVEEK